MTHDQLIILLKEIRDLQKKFQRSRNALLLPTLRRKEAILDAIINREIKPRNSQQILFEAR